MLSSIELCSDKIVENDKQVLEVLENEDLNIYIIDSYIKKNYNFINLLKNVAESGQIILFKKNIIEIIGQVVVDKYKDIINVQTLLNEIYNKVLCGAAIGGHLNIIELIVEKRKDLWENVNLIEIMEYLKGNYITFCRLALKMV